MPAFEEDLSSLCAPGPQQSLPGAVLLASTMEDDLAYYETFGASSLEPSKARELSKESIFWIASCTKLLTSLAVLQLVERGEVDLDTDVCEVLPELRDGPAGDVLVGWNEDGSPRLKKREGSIRLRHLLTHTSGLAYEFLSEDIVKWYAYNGVKVADLAGDIAKSYNVPLLFEPGKKWMYSPGLDWAGVLVERLSGEEDLGTYMAKNIWGKVGIEAGNMAFRKRDLKLSEEEAAERMVHTTLRKQGDGSVVPAEPIWDMNSKDCLGGAGILASPDAYLRVLRSLLRNDGKIMGRETVERYLLEPQLVEGSVGVGAYESLMDMLDNMLGSKMLTGGLPLPKEEGAHEYQHGLLGLLNRPKGEKEWTLSWGGLPNLFWHLSPHTGICGIYASQVIPPGDPKSMEVAMRWREELQKRFGRGGQGKSNL